MILPLTTRSRRTRSARRLNVCNGSIAAYRDKQLLADCRPKLVRRRESDMTAEVFQVVLMGAPDARVVEIGEPFERCWHAAQLLELGSGQPAFTGDQQLAGSASCQTVRLTQGTQLTYSSAMK